MNQIQIFTAQRYSFVLTANQPVGNYWIRAVPDIPLAGSTNDTFANGINSAIFRYNGAPNKNPTSSPPKNFAAINEHLIHPLQNPGAPGKPFPGGADKVINLTLGIDLTTLTFSVNNVSYVSPNVPVLLQILSGTTAAQDLLPPGSVYGVPMNSVIEININGGDALGKQIV